MEKFLEDLDALAGNVAFWHADDGLPATSPLALVTASVEEIRVLRQMDVQSDIVLSGQVVYVRASVLVYICVYVCACACASGRLDSPITGTYTSPQKHP